MPMKPASSKVLFRPKSVLNQTPTSVSLITIKIITAIFSFMAPVNSGTFPRIIREMREVQFYLVRKPLQIRLRRADLTHRQDLQTHDEHPPEPKSGGEQIETITTHSPEANACQQPSETPIEFVP